MGVSGGSCAAPALHTVSPAVGLSEAQTQQGPSLPSAIGGNQQPFSGDAGKAGDVILAPTRAQSCQENGGAQCRSGSPEIVGLLEEKNAILSADNITADILIPAQQGIVGIVTQERTWATGVLVGTAGFLVTNAHLLRPHSQGQSGRSKLLSHGQAKLAGRHVTDLSAPLASPLRVQLAGPGGARMWCKAEIVYIFDGPLDLAVLRLCEAGHGLRPLCLASHMGEEGDPIAVVGHPLLPLSLHLPATVMVGNVARIVYDPASARPAMLLTTATVYPGALTAGHCADH